MWVAVYPDARRRPKKLERLFTSMVGMAIGSTPVVGAGEPLHAVAIWGTPEGRAPVPSPAGLFAWLPLVTSTATLPMLKVRGVSDAFTKMRMRYATEPHFHLETIGVRPVARGSGAAGRLIRPFLETADRRKVAVWAETADTDTLPMFRRLGFEVVESGRDERSGLDFHGLLRRPGAGER